MDEFSPQPEENAPTPSNEGGKVRSVSKRKVLYVELDEEITVIFERIARLNYNEVFLVVPQRAVLFQSIVNLSILKKRVSEIGKTLSLITNDPVGTKLALKAEIPVFDQLSAPPHPDQKEPSTEPEEVSEEPMGPISAVRNEAEDFRPQRLNQKKLSIFDIVRQSKQQRSFSLGAFKKRIDDFRKARKMQKEPSRFALGAPSMKTLGTLVVASLCILLVISYVALPGATVTVTPQSSVIEQGVNIILADATIYGTNPAVEGTHVLTYFPIDTTIEKTLTYTSTGQIFEGTNASGTVTIINERSIPWDLVALTRLQTEDGLIYRIQSNVTVPAATSTGFGTIDVAVVADEEDAYGRVMGERGNIPPTTFFLPGLRESSQEELYARSSSAMAGGSTIVTLKVSQEDLDASEVLMRNELEALAEESLLAEVARRNELNGTNLELLTGYGSIEMGEPSINVPTSLLEALQDQFDVTGSMDVSGIAFDHDDFVSLLSDELETRKSPDKALVKIDADSISYEIIEVDETPGQIKITATIKGIESYILDPEDENGAKLIKKIKEHISGKQIKEAEDYVQNLTEINKVHISTWPVWSPTIPTVLENIEIKMDDDALL